MENAITEVGTPLTPLAAPHFTTSLNALSVTSQKTLYTQVNVVLAGEKIAKPLFALPMNPQVSVTHDNGLHITTLVNAVEQSLGVQIGGNDMCIVVAPPTTSPKLVPPLIAIAAKHPATSPSAPSTQTFVAPHDSTSQASVASQKMPYTQVNVVLEQCENIRHSSGKCTTHVIIKATTPCCPL